MDYNITLPDFVQKFKEGKGLTKIPLSYVEVVGKVLENAIKEKFSLLSDKITVEYTISHSTADDFSVAEYEIYSKENNDLQYVCSMNCVIQ